MAPTVTMLSIAPINTAEPTTLTASKPIALIRRAVEGLTSAALRWTPPEAANPAGVGRADPGPWTTPADPLGRSSAPE